MSIINELRWRGLIHDISDEQQIADLPKNTPFYVGFDPTATSLHLGNLVPLKALIHLAQAGLQPIVLFGGATGAIGDPSGKNAERTLLPQNVIEQNVLKQSEQVKSLLGKFSLEVQFVNNYDWTSSIPFLDFLREVGKYITVNYMTAKEVVRSRLNGSGISFTEFSYMLIQANDFLHLYQHHNCKLQIGGSDQWGNITTGIELIRKKSQGSAYGLSLPLVLDSSGRKFGKSEGEALWLDAELTSPFRLHQYLLNISDEDCVKFIKMFTFITEDELSEIEDTLKSAPEKRFAQQYLADSVVELIHSSAAVTTAKASAEVLFGGSVAGISDTDLTEIFADVPSSEIALQKLQTLNVLDLFVTTGLCSSRGDAKRLIKNGGAYVNNERVNSIEASLEKTLEQQRSVLVLRSGKKSYHLLKVTS